MSKLLSKMLEEEKLTYCDIGARGGLEKPWSSYASLLNVVGFEPDPEEFDRLQKRSGNDVFFPYALGGKCDRATLFITKSPGCSSFLKPNMEFLSLYPNSDRFSIVNEEQVDVVTLDSLYLENKISDIDFIKIDTQGTELAILQGAKKIILEQALAMQVEVEFAPMYENQPLFSTVDQYIAEEFNFDLYDIKRFYWRNKHDPAIGSGKGRMIFGEAFYLISVEGLVDLCRPFSLEKSLNKIRKSAFIGLVHGYHDYVISILSEAFSQSFLSKKDYTILLSIIKKLSRSTRFNIYKGGAISHFLYILSSAFGDNSLYHSDRRIGTENRWTIQT